jgi:hypothetical protein
MLYYPKSIRHTEQRLVVHIPEAGLFINKWINLSEGFKGLSIRFAAGRDTQGSLLVMGVRHEGKGFDIAFRKDAWDELTREPEALEIRYGSDPEDVNLATRIEIPEDSFDAFIESCQQQAEEDSGKKVLAEIAAYFA